MTYWRKMDERWLWKGADALQVDQPGILEHGGDRLRALDADIVAIEAAERRRDDMW